MKNNNSIKYYVDNYPSQIRDMIDEIMDNFDFDRVHAAMVALDWQWVLYGGVPDQSEIRKEARRQLKGCTLELNDDTCRMYRISSGGLEVICAVCDPNDTDIDYIDDALHSISLELRFIIEEQEA